MPVRIVGEATALTAVTGLAGLVAALITGAPALADPGVPNPQPAIAPGPAPQAVLVPQSAPAPAIAPPAPPALPFPFAPPDPAPAPDAAAPAAPNALPTPPNGIPHLSSPQNLPPGTTDVAPDDMTDSGGLGYLRDIWHAYQTQEVDGRGALLLLTQRPMDANAVPPPGMPANPTPPGAPGPPPGPPGA